MIAHSKKGKSYCVVNSLDENVHSTFIHTREYFKIAFFFKICDTCYLLYDVHAVRLIWHSTLSSFKSKFLCLHFKYTQDWLFYILNYKKARQSDSTVHGFYFISFLFIIFNIYILQILRSSKLTPVLGLAESYLGEEKKIDFFFPNQTWYPFDDDGAP